MGFDAPTSEQLDDLLAGLARYLRIPWEYLEAQTISRVLEMSKACGRLLKPENGTQSPLDLRAASEENR